MSSTLTAVSLSLDSTVESEFVLTLDSGKHSVVIPSSLAAGEYLLRAEVIALHVAQSYPGAQFVSNSSGPLHVLYSILAICSTLAVLRLRLPVAAMLTPRRLLFRVRTGARTPASLSTSTTTSRATLRKPPSALPCGTSH